MTFTSSPVRSIPVHTGKPSGVFFPSSPAHGLSPYTRGNRSRLFHLPECSRSIPVHTGKPFSQSGTTLRHQVYPRTHGETDGYFKVPGKGLGLSPYTRGNHPILSVPADRAGSIPVHTGKPSITCGLFISSGVYPRTHGETGRRQWRSADVQGLSPYTRGNLAFRGVMHYLIGSIPVHTGKPTSSRTA